jgi:hypothetical protein
MPRERNLERTDIEVFTEGMREQGYSPDTINIVKEQAENIEPGMEHLESENVIYVAVMPDDSGSIGGQNPLKRDNTQAVIDGHNTMVEALSKSQDARTILFKTLYLNSDKALNNWVPLNNVVLMTRDNFKPEGTTPLYDKTLSLLRSVIYERTEALKRGHSKVRWGILLITDGDDYGSTNPASQLAR